MRSPGSPDLHAFNALNISAFNIERSTVEARQHQPKPSAVTTVRGDDGRLH